MKRTALLVMDVQHAILAGVPDPESYVDRLATAIQAARDRAMPVIHVTVGFRPGHPEIHPDNQAFGGLIGTDGLVSSNPASAIHPRVAPLADEPVVVKRFVGSFSGTDLDTLLRAADIRTLVLAGLITSGAVLSTVRQATELQYQQVVLADGCADPDEEVQRVLVEKVFPREAQVLTTQDWIDSLPA